MTVEVDNKGPAVGYLDPVCLCSTTRALLIFYLDVLFEKDLSKFVIWVC
jgi:hypothetical protein